MESAIYSYLIISAALCFHSAGAFNHEDSDILEVLVNSEIQIENGSMLDEDVELEIQNMTSHMEREMATLPPLLIPFCQYYNQTGKYIVQIINCQSVLCKFLYVSCSNCEYQLAFLVVVKLKIRILKQIHLKRMLHSEGAQYYYCLVTCSCCLV